MAETGAPPLMALAGVTKRFPGVLACDRIDLAIRPGEVHALLGENGAGKSTLVGILSGLTPPDAGTVRVGGQAVALRSPRHALDLGIGTVFQHAMLVPTLSLADNLLLGGPWWQRPDRAGLAARIGALAAGLGLTVRLDARAADLSLGEQQQAEILRALARGSRVLILDESTSMLTPGGIAELGALMRRMAGQGLGVLFITHKLREAVEFGDRITVLKQGRKAGEIPPDRMGAPGTIAEVVELMFGREAAAGAAPGGTVGPGVRLRVQGLGLPPRGGAPGLGGVAFDLAPGEIFGIAGIDGNGQSQLAGVLSGQIAASAGSVTLDGADITALGVGARRRRGLRYLTDDRLGEGTVGPFSVALNLVLKDVGAAPFWRRGIEQRGVIAAEAARLVHAYDVRTPGVETPVAKLSGGNIQKVLLARELAEGARAVIFAKPTHGLDLANTQAVHRRIRALAEQGIAVLLISTDLDEILGLSHRIGVLAGGRLVGTLANGPAARQDVGRLMVGVAA